MREINFKEQQILFAVRKLLTEKVNEYLRDLPFQIPIVEFGIFRSDTVIAPLISISSCEQTEKERIVKQDTYSITATFPVLDNRESELYCYAYAAALQKALDDDVTLGGIADSALITSKKYILPKKTGCGENWEIIISMQITIEAL